MLLQWAASFSSLVSFHFLLFFFFFSQTIRVCDAYTNISDVILYSTAASCWIGRHILLCPAKQWLRIFFFPDFYSFALKTVHTALRHKQKKMNVILVELTPWSHIHLKMTHTQSEKLCIIIIYVNRNKWTNRLKFIRCKWNSKEKKGNFMNLFLSFQCVEMESQKQEKRIINRFILRETVFWQQVTIDVT